LHRQILKHFLLSCSSFEKNVSVNTWIKTRISVKNNILIQYLYEYAKYTGSTFQIKYISKIVITSYNIIE